jgi:hypothetical protein
VALRPPQSAMFARVGQRRSPGGMCRNWQSLALATAAPCGVGTWTTTAGSQARGNSRAWRQSLFALSDGSRGVDPLPPARTQDGP